MVNRVHFLFLFRSSKTSAIKYLQYQKHTPYSSRLAISILDTELNGALTAITFLLANTGHSRREEKGIYLKKSHKKRNRQNTYPRDSFCNAFRVSLRSDMTLSSSFSRSIKSWTSVFTAFTAGSSGSASLKANFIFHSTQLNSPPSYTIFSNLFDNVNTFHYIGYIIKTSLRYI